MQDLKHLTRKKANLIQRHWKTTSICLAVLLLVIPLSILLVRKAAQAVSVYQAAKPAANQKRPPLKTGAELFATASSLLPDATDNGGNLAVTTQDGTALTLSINSNLQQRVNSYLQQSRPPFAVFVAIEPSTGRVLSLTGYSSVEDGWGEKGAFQIYPMASLFKLVTAVAALENGKITPETTMEFRGRLVSESPGNWDPHPKGRNHKMDVSDAMAKSVNPIYGIIASDLLGKEQLRQACDRFGFNRSLFLPGVPTVTSLAPDVATVKELRLQGCGLDHDLQVSPIHAAAITAAIANRGDMLAPRLVDRAVRDGKMLNIPGSSRVARVTTPEVAADLTRMMLDTVTSGTSRKAFQTADGRRLLKGMKIAAKTGSIDGDNPKGHYSWFAAYAPADRPAIAVVALVINGDKWRIKGSNLGEHALTAFFSQTALPR